MKKYRQKKTIGAVIFVCALVFILFFFPFQVQAAEAIGKVVAMRGKITAVDQNHSERILTLKAPVYLNDTIHTGKGRIQLMFEDNTLITLGRDTRIKITIYAWKPGDKTSAMETRIEEGSFRIMGGAITRTAPENFKTQTPSGTIGIRGSMYAGQMKDNVLSVLFQGGKGIYVKNDIGLVNIDRPGFGTVVKGSDLPPGPPKKMSQQELNEMEKLLATALPDESAEDVGSSENPAADPAAGPEPETKLTDNGTSQTDTDAAPPEEKNPDDTGSSETLAADPGDSSEGTLSDTPMLAAEAPVSSDPFNSGPDLASIAGDAVLSSTQDSLSTDLQPTGTQQKIELLLINLGYSEASTKSGSVPSSGIWFYAGKMQNTLTSEADQPIKFIVNWDNHRTMVFEPFSVGSTSQGTGFGFGTVTATGDITNVKVLGSDNDSSNPVKALNGSQTFGQIYGSNSTGIGLALEGYDVNVQNQANTYFWSDILAATLETQLSNPYSGTETWEGFYVGVAEDMTAPNTNRRIFQNTSTGSADFSLTIDKDAGTISGSMSGEDFNTAGNTINAMTIGGTGTDSVFISDQNLAATISGISVITISPTSTDLKTYGNYLVTSRKTALSNYTTWGYWEVAYQDPVSSKPYHVHVPGSLWIAGVPTLSATVTGLISSNFSGTYTGGAEGVMFDSSSQMTQLTGGTSSLTIDFNSVAATPVSGNIIFDQVTLPVTSTTGNVTSSGFIGTISSAVSSKVAGTYYGTNAESIGGNFSAQMGSGTQYHGIFGGDR